MSDLRELLRRGLGEVRPGPDALERTLERIRVRRRNRRMAATGTALALGLAALVFVWAAFRPAAGPTPGASPTGLIVFSTQGPQNGNATIAVMNADGSDVRTLTPGDQPALSPDGTRIAFVRTTSAGTGIWVMDLDGSDQTQLTSNPDGMDGSPTWSADGSGIAFDRDTRLGEPRRIYVMASDGTGVHAITSEGWDRFEPAWSPDGTRIAFVTAGPGTIEANGNPPQIWLMNEDGSEPTQLTSGAAGAWRPSWSPDGSQLAFDDGNGSMFVVNADGSGLRGFDLPMGGSGPTWSPDGTMIAFTNQNHAIFEMNLQGEDVRRVSPTTSSAWAPSWGSGTRIGPATTTRCVAARTSGDFDGDGTTDEAEFVQIVSGQVSCKREADVVRHLLSQEIDVRFGSGKTLEQPFTDCQPCLMGGGVFTATDLDGDGRDELAVDVGPGAAIDYVEFYRVDPDGIRPLVVADPGDPPYVEPGRAILGGGFDSGQQSPSECRLNADGTRELISIHAENLTGPMTGPWKVHTTTMVLEGDRLVVTSTSDSRGSEPTIGRVFQDLCR